MGGIPLGIRRSPGLARRNTFYCLPAKVKNFFCKIVIGDKKMDYDNPKHTHS